MTDRELEILLTDRCKRLDLKRKAFETLETLLSDTSNNHEIDLGGFDRTEIKPMFDRFEYQVDKRHSGSVIRTKVGLYVEDTKNVWLDSLEPIGYYELETDFIPAFGNTFTVSRNLMRPFLLLPIFSLLLSFTSWGQTRAKNYQLIFGIDTFTATTFIKPETFDKKSLREYTYLFKDGRQIIKIPRRIDTIAVYNLSSNPVKRRIEIDTVDQIVVSKIVDTIDRQQLEQMINTEIQIFLGKRKLKFDEAQFEAIQPSGKTSFTIDLQKTRIREGSHAFEKISTLDKGGYLILKTVWFSDLKDDRREIECNVAWLINE